MFDQFKQTLTKLFAADHERARLVRPRGTLERLEDRMMLSATYGDFGYSRPAPASHPYGDFGPPPASSSAAVAFPQQQQGTVYYNSQSFSLPLPQHITGGWQQLAPAPAWNQGFAGLPAPYYEMIVYQSGPGYSKLSYVKAAPWGTMTISHINVGSAGVSRGAPPVEGDGLGVNGALPKANRLTGSNYTTNPTGTNDREYSHNTSPAPSGVGTITTQTGKPRSPEYFLANYTPAASDMPIAAPVLSRETSTVASLTAAARDVAFQEFSQSLFQPNATTALERTNSDTLSRDATPSDAMDGLMQPSDQQTNDAVANSSDAVTREREAVDAVLDDLEDVDSLAAPPEAQTQNRKADLPTDAALDDLPAGEVDGGMVLLQSTGDANDNGFDLTPVYAAQVGRLPASAKMETSIGIFYQAMDVASDDAPLLEAAPRAESTLQQKGQLRLGEEGPAKFEQSSAGKAAALVGATILTGALVWMNYGGRIALPEQTAQKRRVARG
jgi:hypothetical protein